jgi:DNA-binding NarL/FixJ family response regulator
MPELAGLEVLKRLRQEGNSLPVIMLAEHTDTPYAKIVLETGATAFLGKDDGFDALINTIQCIRESCAEEKDTASATN